MPSVNRVEPFSALSDVYQAANFAQFSLALAPRLLDLAFDLDWTGSNMLDLACGTGDLANWFGEHSLRVTGIDSSPHMLRHANARSDSASNSSQFINADIRTWQADLKFDLVTCLGGSLNYAPTMRDLESIFKVIATSLVPGKLFLFDLFTIQGLAKVDQADRVLYDNGTDAMIITRESFNYETLLLTRQYLIWRYSEKTGWQRADETHSLRGFPVQAITTALTRAGLKLMRTLTPSLEPVDGQHDLDHILFVGVREG